MHHSINGIHNGMCVYIYTHTEKKACKEIQQKLWDQKTYIHTHAS